MRVVVTSCHAYRDAWKPFLALFEKFVGGPITLLTDGSDAALPSWVNVQIEKGSWCEMLRNYAQKQSEPFLLFQEDFFIHQADSFLIGIAEALTEKADCVRIYPCPGADEPIYNDFYGKVSLDAPYVISCQAAFWNPRFLEKIIEPNMHTPADFEITGSYNARQMDCTVYAFKRELKPWPIEYLCSAIGRGMWSQDAKKLCDKYGIKVDWSMRPMQAA